MTGINRVMGRGDEGAERPFHNRSRRVRIESDGGLARATAQDSNLIQLLLARSCRWAEIEYERTCEWELRNVPDAEDYERTKRKQEECVIVGITGGEIGGKWGGVFHQWKCRKGTGDGPEEEKKRVAW
ncbi:hypothetical protein B0H14DRAFT_3161155 [Mycena olivaceomarginata]|nr:hypothetical protein B0H14DRAFT_3161155 [Mycena olivaceomarginata]